MKLKYLHFLSKFSIPFFLVSTFYSSAASADAYAPGTFTFKPLNINVSSFSGGFTAQDSKFISTGLNATTGTVFPLVPEIRTIKTDAYRTTLPFGFSESDRNGIGYGVEMGYVIGRDWEAFGRAGYSHERPMPRFTVGNRSYDFHERNNYGLSLGVRHYIDMESAWKPFFAAALGFVSQGQTKARIYGHALLSNNPNNDPLLGNYRLLKAKALLSCELAIGTDYAFNKNWALSASVAVRYNQRGGSNVINTPGFFSPQLGPFPPQADIYADNKQRWYIPVTLSLKFMF
jgi:hypothetical protein